MGHRDFTPEEATATLPYVERIVRDIVAAYGEWKDALERYELAVAGVTVATGESPEAEEMRCQVDALAARIEGLVQELTPVGCTVKGFDDGLVHFPSREGPLRWRLGEASVEG